MAYKLSTRISLRWLPDPPSEPTDTLVFGVGSYYMDLRVRKSDQALDWALAGERQVLSTQPLKCRWIKTLDSLGLTDPDEGSFAPLPNGDSLETGSMPCPERGMAVTEYEEVWRVLEPVPGPHRAWILESVEGEEKKVFLGRIGGGFMALCGSTEGKEGFGARSEVWNQNEKTWTVKHTIGDVEGVPSVAVVASEGFDGEEGWQAGNTVVVLGREYLVRAFETLK